jgi:hypothetical protein
VIAGIVALASGSVMGLLVVIVGPLVVRIYCELLIVVFRINDTLTGIWYNTQRPGP